MKAILFPGFFSTADSIANALPEEWALKKMDYFKNYSETPSRGSLSAWVKTHRNVFEPDSILVGYSLGGRVALTVAEMDPGEFKGVVLLSTHPMESKMPIERKKEMAIWINRFEKEPLEDLRRDWNSQSVFEGTSYYDPPENDLDRQGLLNALKFWTIDDVFVDWSKLRIPLIWLYGEKDTKYLPFIYNKRPGTKVLVKGAGHRLHRDQPEVIKTILKEWGKQLWV